MVLLFNKPVTAEKPLKHFTNLATKIIEGKVRLASTTEIGRSLYSDPVWLKKDYVALYQSLKMTFKNQPILNVSNSAKKIVGLLEAFPLQSIVVIVPEIVMHILKNRFCGLDFLSDDLKNTDYQGWNSNDVIYPGPLPPPPHHKKDQS